LTLEQVDLLRKLAWIHPDQPNARKTMAVPLNEMAMQIVRAKTCRYPMLVITYEGQPVMRIGAGLCIARAVR
jgi:hypothetical protein